MRLELADVALLPGWGQYEMDQRRLVSKTSWKALKSSTNFSNPQTLARYLPTCIPTTPGIFSTEIFPIQAGSCFYMITTSINSVDEFQFPGGSWPWSATFDDSTYPTKRKTGKNGAPANWMTPLAAVCGCCGVLRRLDDTISSTISKLHVYILSNISCNYDWVFSSL